MPILPSWNFSIIDVIVVTKDAIPHSFSHQRTTMEKTSSSTESSQAMGHGLFTSSNQFASQWILMQD
ncbi:hypothetical protein NPIL_89561 [Nephila pilipes]|uniref:Uncharacterized protein n=1 Tax=Nephila pilipes TaxID=299642 RepID=A0A8X6N1D8_NEPPI|nr:hypothetical protein NPIL_89561 [Nephila pilipes]